MKFFKLILLVILVSAAKHFVAQDVSIIPNQIIIQFHYSETENFTIKNNQYRLVETLSKGMNIFLFEKNEGMFNEDEINRIGSDASVKAVQFNHTVERRSLVPDDPFFAQQWNMLNTGQLNGKPSADINAIPAWAINTSPLTKNGDTIVVAVIDEYFDINHEDINFFINHNEIPNNGIDDDGNGFIDDYYGWNAYQNNGNVLGAGGTNHSTLISGIVGAKGNNNKGVAGVVWGVKVMAVGASSTNEAVVIKGYDYVIEMRKLYNATSGAKGAFIVATNSSFGVNNGQPQNFPIWCALYDTMGKLGILNATATTNGNVNVDVVGDIPTTCPSKWMVAVTGTTSSDNRYGGFGLKNIHLAAPAGSVISTAVNNNYTSSTGTSFACPHVAGAVAAMFAEACPKLLEDYETFPDSITLLMKDWMLNGVSKTEALNNRTISDGRLNLHAAILKTHNYNCNNCSSSVAVQTTDVVCKKEANGTAIVSVSNSSGNSFQWNDGSTDATRNNLSPGLYQLTITDDANCEHQATIIIREPDTLRINAINVVPPVGGNSGNIIVNAYSGGDSLWYSLDGSTWQLNNVFSINTEGVFTVYVKNESGCVATQTVLISSIDDELQQREIQVYPNPARDAISVVLSSQTNKQLDIFLMDLAGRTVKTAKILPAQNSTQIKVEELSGGVYFLKVAEGDFRKLMIVR